MRQPRGGVPDPEWDPTDLMLVVVLIYGQRVAGRTFWNTFRGGIIEAGMEENRFVPAMYFVKKELPDKTWDVVMTMVTHVDDLAWSDNGSTWLQISRLLRTRPAPLLRALCHRDSSFRHCRIPSAPLRLLLRRHYFSRHRSVF